MVLEHFPVKWFHLAGKCSSARRCPCSRWPGAGQNNGAPEGAPSVKPFGGAGAFLGPMRIYSLLSAIDHNSGVIEVFASNPPTTA